MPPLRVLRAPLCLLVAGCAASNMGGDNSNGHGGGPPEGVVITGAGGGPGGDMATGAGGGAGSPPTTGGSGGSAPGGTGGAAGASSQGGTGGAPPAPEPKLVTSAQGAYWKVGTLTEVTAG